MVFTGFIIESASATTLTTYSSLIVPPQRRNGAWASTSGTSLSHRTLHTTSGYAPPSFLKPPRLITPPAPYTDPLSTVDHGHLRSLSCLLLLGQTLHPPLLPPRLPSNKKTPLHDLRPDRLLYLLLRPGLRRRRWLVQCQKPRLGHNVHDELLRVWPSAGRGRRTGLGGRYISFGLSGPASA